MSSHIIQNIYSIFDKASGIYERPFTIATDQLAKRSMVNLLTQKNSMIVDNPEDFTLFHIASFDSSSGEMVPNEQPRVVIRFHELVAEIQMIQEARIQEY